MLFAAAMSSWQSSWLLLSPGYLKSQTVNVLQGNLLSESAGEVVRCAGVSGSLGLEMGCPQVMDHCDSLQLFFLVFIFIWLMWFNLYSCNLHSWIIPSKASICLNFGLFSKHLFDANGNQSYMYMFLHNRFPGLEIKLFLKQVHLMQRHSRGFCSLWSCHCCLYLSCRFCPATLCSTLIFAGSSLPCSRVLLLAVLLLSVPVAVASPMFLMSWQSHGCRAVRLLHLCVVRSLVSSHSSVSSLFQIFHHCLPNIWGPNC